MALISVIIPVYGTERLISRCLDSVLSQTFKDIEIVVVNDCTKDNAMDIVTRYAERNKNIKTVEHSTNQGPMVARKTGYRAASGQYIVFLDSDDTLPIDALSTLYGAIQDSGCKIVSGGYRYIYDNGNSVERLPLCIGTFSAKKALELCLERKLNHNLAFAIFDRTLFNNEFITYPHQTNAEDLILFYQLLKVSGAIKVIPNIVYNYYQNFASSSNAAPNLAILKQWANAQNFKYSFCLKAGVDKKILLNNILGIVVLWPTVKDGKEVYKELDKDIRAYINPIYFFKYFPFTKAAYFTLLNLMPSFAAKLKQQN